MFGNRDPRHTPHQVASAGSGEEAEEGDDSIATDGGTAAVGSNQDTDERSVEECLVDFLRFAASKTDPHSMEVQEAGEAIAGAISDIQEEEEINDITIVMALYDILLRLEQRYRK